MFVGLFFVVGLVANLEEYDTFKVTFPRERGRSTTIFDCTTVMLKVNVVISDVLNHSMVGLAFGPEKKHFLHNSIAIQLPQTNIAHSIVPAKQERTSHKETGLSTP